MANNVTTRRAEPDDAAPISGFLQQLTALGKRTLPDDADYVRNKYIANPLGVECSVAVEGDGTMLGLQILLRAGPDDPYGIAEGQGCIGTHVAPAAARRGVGRALFDRTLSFAKQHGMDTLQATIGADNTEGLAYYGAMGFETIREGDGRILKSVAI